jgi:hypothetical protein
MKGEIGSAVAMKANDQALGPLVSWRTEKIVTGEDEDGDLATATILSSEPVAGTTASAKASARAEIALNALDYAMASHAQEPPQGVEAPPRVCSSDKWKDELFRLGVLDRNAKNPRVPFQRLRESLIKTDLIGESCGWVWSKASGPGGYIRNERGSEI